MTRPTTLSYQDFQRWETNIQQDSGIPASIKKNPIIMEVLFAGLWLAEELSRLLCPPEYITRIQYTAGQISFGRDPWEVHLDVLERYKSNELQFDPDPDNLN